MHLKALALALVIPALYAAELTTETQEIINDAKGHVSLAKDRLDRARAHTATVRGRMVRIQPPCVPSYAPPSRWAAAHEGARRAAEARHAEQVAEAEEAERLVEERLQRISAWANALVAELTAPPAEEAPLDADALRARAFELTLSLSKAQEALSKDQANLERVNRTCFRYHVPAVPSPSHCAARKQAEQNWEAEKQARVAKAQNAVDIATNMVEDTKAEIEDIRQALAAL